MSLPSTLSESNANRLTQYNSSKMSARQPVWSLPNPWNVPRHSLPSTRGTTVPGDVFPYCRLVEARLSHGWPGPDPPPPPR